jgi:hypothetical protein
MRPIATLTLFTVLTAGLVAAEPPDWSRSQVAAALDEALAAAPRTTRLLDAEVSDARIVLNLGAGSDAAVAGRAALAAISRLPGDAGRVTLILRANGAALRRASTRATRQIAATGEPSATRLLLTADEAAAGAASTLQAVLSSEGFSVGDSGPAAVALELRATPGAAPLVAYSNEDARVLATTVQAGLAGARLVDCAACFEQSDAPSVLVELGDSASNASTVMSAALALRGSLRSLSTTADRSATQGQMISPAAGSTLSGSTVTFGWNAGSAATGWAIIRFIRRTWARSPAPP